MLFTSGNVSANVARLGTMSSADKDTLIVRMATEIRQLRQYVYTLHRRQQLTDDMYQKAFDQIMSRLDYIERLAGPSGPSTVIHTVQHQWNSPPSQIAPPAQARVEMPDLGSQVEALLPKPSDPVMVDTPQRPFNVIDFEAT